MIEFNEYDVPSLVKKAHTNVCRRQDAPKTYDMNASIYVWNRVALFGSINLINSFTKVYIMPEDRSLDIDSELDFQIVEYLMNRRLS
jgi:CMP-N-acetylneuraminic acid synthetase